MILSTALSVNGSHLAGTGVLAPRKSYALSLLLESGERMLNVRDWARLHQLNNYIPIYFLSLRVSFFQALLLTLPFLDLVLLLLLGLTASLVAYHFPVFFFNPLLAFMYSGSRSSSESTSACPIRLDQGALSGLVGSGEGARSSVE